MASDHALAIYLDAPMQAWGCSSRFQRRGTESYPTKSGVLGIIAAALGIDKHGKKEAEELAQLAELRFCVYGLKWEKNNHEMVRLEDYHTVGGGYDRADPHERMHISRKAAGAPSTTVLTHRTYLTDARFVATLEGTHEALQRCSSALENPVWGIWFGRKCCLPAAPLSPVLADTASAAIDRLLDRFPKEHRPLIASGQSEESTDGSWHQSDQPVSYGGRKFVSRPVRRI